MTDVPAVEEATLFPKSVGERLREAREAQGLSLAEIAARTRVPVRQLEAIELGNFAALPSITYAVGFAKSYARAVGVDEVAVGREVRGHSDNMAVPRRTEYETFAVDEPGARAPARGLVIGAVLVALLLVIAGGLWFGTNLFREGGETAAVAPSAPEQVPEAAAVGPVAPVAAPGGAVVLTATDEVWLKVYDTDKTLFQGTLKAGEHYDLPADATGAMINVGRPDQLQVTVGGTPVAPLGDGRVAIKDVPISAAALAARGVPLPTPSATPGATQADRPVTTPTPQRRATPVRERAAAPAGSATLNIAAPVEAPPQARPTPAPTATPTP